MGKKVALDMASEGAKISSIDINKEGIDSLKKEIEASGGQCITIKCDVSSSREITEMVQHTMDAFKTLILLLTVHGLYLQGALKKRVMN